MGLRLAAARQRQTEILVALLALGVGTALALLPLQTGALALLAIIGGLAALKWPGLALFLLPLAVPFGELRTLNLGGLQAGGVEALLALLMLAWLAQGLARRDIRLAKAPLLLPLLLFIATLLLSTLGATSLPSALKEIVKWGQIAIVYVLVLALADEAGPRRRQFIVGLTLALVAAASLEAVSGIVQSVQRVGPPSFAILGGRLWRAFGEFGQPNPFGGYINMTLMPVLSALVGLALGGLTGAEQPVARRGGQVSTTAVVAVGLAGVAGLLGLALILSWSRGAWFGAAAGGLVVLVGWMALTLARPAPHQADAVRRRAVRVLWGLGLAALLMALLGAANLVPAGVSGRLSSVTEYFGGFDVVTIEVTNENFAVVERVAHWYAAIGMWTDHFWTGVGAGNYAAVYDLYRVPRWTDPLGHAHNYYLNIGAEAGLIGWLAYLLLTVAAMGRALRVAARRTDWLTRSLALGALGLLVAVATHNLFDNLYVHSMGVHLALIIGLVDSADAQA